MLRGFLAALALYKGGVEDCTPRNALGKVIETGIYPQNPKAGDLSSLWVNFYLSKQIYSGTVTYSVKWNYIPMEPEVDNLCHQMICPIYTGFYNVSGNTTFPEIHGLVEVTTEWADSDNTPIWCVKTTYNL
jgi:hypothetical protein